MAKRAQKMQRRGAPGVFVDLKPVEGIGRSFARREHGQAMVEFALIAPIAITFLFLTLEYGLALAVHTVARWAAWEAARAASVFVPLDERSEAIALAPAAAPEVEAAGELAYPPRDTAKWHRIKMAADNACAAIVSPGTLEAVRPILRDAAWEENSSGLLALSHAMALADVARGAAGTGGGGVSVDNLTLQIRDRLAAASILTEVELIDPSTGQSPTTAQGGTIQYQPGDLIAVEVRIQYPLVLPLARRILGSSRYVAYGEAGGNPSPWTDCSLKSQKAAGTELEGAQFFTITGRSALPCEAMPPAAP